MLKDLQTVGEQAKGQSKPIKVVGWRHTTKRIKTDAVILTLALFSMRAIQSIMTINIGPVFLKAGEFLLSVSIARRVY